MAHQSYLRPMSHIFHLDGCSILLGDLKAHFPAWLRERGYSRLFLVADTNTQELCLPCFLEKTSLQEGFSVEVMPAGERFKNLDTCQHVWLSMLDARLDRRALVINLGGGVVGDLGGFCAATWKRGVDFVQVPTTLLAMTDAAIGGKLGIDFQGVKNTLGVFQNPAAVFVDPSFLKTLPERELRSGLAEIIKHALIGAPSLLEKIMAECVGALVGDALSDDGWASVLRASIAVKVRIVQDDPMEKGVRALLNFGHTIGHALESYFLDTAEPLTHGEAIAIGMICESRMGDAVNLEDIIAVNKRFFTHRHIPASAFSALWDLMRQDKKNAAGAVRMTLPGDEPFSMRMVEVKREMMEEGLAFYNGI